METSNINNVYFLGAGGIGMSALVRYFLSRNICVAGYDRTATQLTGELESEGAQLHYQDDVQLIPEAFHDRLHTLVVYTPAIPDDHSELQYFKQNGFELMKRAQVLGIITRQMRGLCVAGTHGKTTTSTMVAHILHQSSVGCSAFLGGISKNYHTNLLLSRQSDYVVIEADEFDRSFHWLTPYISIITATDADHLDIYGTKEAYLEGFAHYTSLIRPDGALIVHTGLELQPRLNGSAKQYTYSQTEGDFHADNVRVGNGEITFDFISPLGNIPDVRLGVPVYVNIENGIAAMAMAQLCGVEGTAIRSAMASFGGVDRRFDFQIKTTNLVFLSDYAHHPEEIRQSILSMRALYPGKKLTGVFQPHLYTRTRDFHREFAESLSLLDEVILLDIYPAREKPIPGISSQLIYDELKPGIEKSVCSKENLAAFLKTRKIDVLITLGAGDIDNLVPQIREMLLHG